MQDNQENNEEQITPEQPDVGQDNLGVWFNKSDWKDFYLNSEVDVIPEGYTRAKPLDGVEYQQFDEEAGEWVADPDGERQGEIAALKTALATIDQEAGAGRAIRGLALRAAQAAGLDDGEDYRHLAEYEDHAEPLRERIKQLQKPQNGENQGGE
jgi:hypothetical protein